MPIAFSKALRYGNTHFTRKQVMPAFTLQPQSVTALWPVLIFRLAEARRLSWPEWLVTN